MHKNDQNFPMAALDALDQFTRNFDTISSNPEKHAEIVREVKMECILATEYSPYLEVRANTESTDEPDMACMTFRAMLIGTFFAAGGSFIDTLFGFRQPPIYVGASVGQLLACESRRVRLIWTVLKTTDPMGRFLAKVLPTHSVTLFGHQMSLNPGPFTRKEHMLITM